MAKRIKDLTGQRFGMLTAVSISHRKGTRTYWNCKCDCGGTRVVSGDHLKRMDNTDCGCTRKHISYSKKHGMSNSRLYTIWALMKYRCNNPNRKEYQDYGGRGIRICKEWNDPQNFINWALNNGYSDDLTLDRIDNNSGYCPENCRWATKSVQMNNRRTCRYITHNGETKTISQWAKEKGMSYNQLKRRIDNYGWSIEKALNEPLHSPKKEK